MPRVRFTATPQLRSWTHRKATFVVAGDGRRLVPPVVMGDGEEVVMDDFDAKWCMTYYPDNFTVVGMTFRPSDVLVTPGDS